MTRRVAVTGIGAVTPVGNDAESTWRSLVAGRSGVGRITTFDPETFTVKIAGLVKDFELGPEIWTREHTFAWMGRILRQREHIHLVQVERHEPVPTIDLRAEGVHELRWWTLSELEAAEETLVPRRLPEFLRELMERGAPPKPVDVGI